MRSASKEPEIEAGMSRISNGSGKVKTDIDEKELEGVLERIAKSILRCEVKTRSELQNRKMKEVKASDLDFIPSNSLILDYIRRSYPDVLERVTPILVKKPSRTLSGVAVVSVMTSPHSCPHGRCVFCPGGEQEEIPTPQSYTGKEPAAMRGAQHGFDPFKQVKARVGQLSRIGHTTDKVDMIIMGGTMPARDPHYQENFVKGCFDGLNGSISGSLIEAQQRNETAVHRCIGLTYETRPDWCGENEIDTMLRLSVTRVELGVQTVFDEPLRKSCRGHTVKDSIESTRLLKDAGLKVNYHIMPGIPGSTREMDLESARRIFEQEEFKPDMIKIYPTLVIAGTELYDRFRSGEYTPLSTQDAAELVADIKELTPPWVRIQRVQRDIPSPLVEGGVKNSNLRQLANEILTRRGRSCRCIRCREIGHKLRSDDEPPGEENIEIVRREYDASQGREIFLSFEETDRDILVGFLRLRIPSGSTHRSEETEKSAMVRELKVFGSMVPLGESSGDKWQHRGFGGRLLAEGERIAKDEMGRDRILITSGVGVREYYRKSGYSLNGPYMEKCL